MNAKTCRLCGKPLGRMRAGAEEFCSREHQNQYRLRVGMDRLMEANKVASLMRRRENPKQVCAPVPLPTSANEAHAFPAAAARAALEHEISLPGARVDHAWETAASCPPARWLGVRPNPASRRVADDTAGFFTGRAMPWLLSRRVPPQTAELLQARIVRFGRLVSMPAHKVRQLAVLRRSGFRIALGNRIFVFRPAGGPGSKYAGPRLGARRILALAREGRVLRASANSGFRVQPLQKRAPTLKPERAPAVEVLRSPRGRLLGIERHPVAGMPTVSAAAVAIEAQQIRPPAGPKAHMATALPFLGAVTLSTREVRDFHGTGPRRLSTEWGKPEGCLMPGAGGLASLPYYPVANARAISPAKVPAAPSAPRVAAARFVPQESTVGMAQVTIQGAAAGTPAAKKPRAGKKGTSSVMEEHFAAGWEDWMGGVEDWELDAAGVRTGSLALYKPSLDKRDYEVEFLARIDNTSVGWVLRASGLRDYQLANIALAPGGGYKFTRRAVKGGVAGPPVTTAVRPAPRGARATLTVRTRVKGNEFTVFIGGQQVDRWTDNRYPTGGIGFVGTPEDRARLYWVKLTPGGPVRSKS